MNERISIHIGQTGVQLGAASWQLFCLEHGISSDGLLDTDAGDIGDFNPTASSFFHDNGEKLTPRSLFIDSNQSAIDSIRSTLYSPQSFVSEHEDEDALLESSLEGVRRLAEQCSNPEGFIIYRSYSGHTGARIGSRLTARLSDDFGGKEKAQVAFAPSPSSSDPREHYNAVLAASNSLEHAGVTFLMDNDAIRGIYRGLGVLNPTYRDINLLAAQLVSSTTAGMRFDSALNTSIGEIRGNLVPYPGASCLLCSHAPVVGTSPTGVDADPRTHTISLARSLADPASSLLASCELYGSEARSFGCTLALRGPVVPSHVGQDFIMTLKHRMRFVDWCPSGFRVGISYRPPVVAQGSSFALVPRTCTMLVNSTAVCDVFERIGQGFDSHFQHLSPDTGMEYEGLLHAREQFSVLQRAYSDVHQWANVDRNDSEGDDY